MSASANCQLLGRWRIVEADLWDRSFLALDAGRVFALPTYLFVVSFPIGVGKALLAGGHPQAAVPPPALSRGTEAASLWLLLRAFASSCAAQGGNAAAVELRRAGLPLEHPAGRGHAR